MNMGRCAACKYLRRRCPKDCIFSPYFPPNNPHRFASVHRIFGASNVGKMLQQLPVHFRGEAADTLYYEAQCRIENPVYGCVGIVTQLHEEIVNAEKELARAQAQVAVHQHQHQHQHHPQNVEAAVTGARARAIVHDNHTQEVEAAVTGPGAVAHHNHTQEVAAAGTAATADLDENEFDFAALMSPSNSNWFY